MDITLSEDDERFRRNAREVVRREHPTAAVRAAEDLPLGFDPAIYLTLGGLGYLGLLIPEDLGGSGGSWLLAALFHEEAGRALLTGPYLAGTVAAQRIARLGSERQRALVGRVASGEAMVTLAIEEADGTANAERFMTRAARSDSGWTVTGVKAFVPFAEAAEAYLVAARMEPAGDAPTTGLFLLPADGERITVRGNRLMSGEPSSELTFSEALAEPIGDAADLELLLDELALLEAARAVGMAAELLDRAADYAKERVQFGRPIGSFQAIQHMLADLAVEIDGSRLLVQQTAWRRDVGDDWRALLPSARLCAAATFRQAARIGHQVHGGYGFIMETDVQLFVRRSKLYEVNATGAERQRDRIAAALGI